MVQIEQAAIDDLAVNLGQTFYMDLTTSNTTGAVATKDMMAAFGTYNATTGVFTMTFGYVRAAVSIATGTAMNSVTCAADVGGIWDVLGAIGAYNATTKVFTVENAVVKVGELNVKGVAVTGLVLRV